MESENNAFCFCFILDRLRVNAVSGRCERQAIVVAEWHGDHHQCTAEVHTQSFECVANNDCKPNIAQVRSFILHHTRNSFPGQVSTIIFTAFQENNCENPVSTPFVVTPPCCDLICDICSTAATGHCSTSPITMRAYPWSIWPLAVWLITGRSLP